MVTELRIKSRASAGGGGGWEGGQFRVLGAVLGVGIPTPLEYVMDALAPLNSNESFFGRDGYLEFWGIQMVDLDPNF